jgi:hypothetical protein
MAVAGLFLSMSVPVEATEQAKHGKNQTSEEATQWVAAAGDRFFLELYGTGSQRLVLTTDPRAGAGQSTGRFFLITKGEAAAIVQVLVDCGLWSRPDTLPEIPFGRILTLGTRNGRDARAWRLGDGSDDVSSMVIIQHLLKSSKGERKQALNDWLSVRRGTEKK